MPGGGPRQIKSRKFNWDNRSSQLLEAFSSSASQCSINLFHAQTWEPKLRSSVTKIEIFPSCGESLLCSVSNWFYLKKPIAESLKGCKVSVLKVSMCTRSIPSFSTTTKYERNTVWTSFLKKWGCRSSKSLTIFVSLFRWKGHFEGRSPSDGITRKDCLPQWHKMRACCKSLSKEWWGKRSSDDQDVEKKSSWYSVEMSS